MNSRNLAVGEYARRVSGGQASIRGWLALSQLAAGKGASQEKVEEQPGSSDSLRGGEGCAEGENRGSGRRLGAFLA